MLASSICHLLSVPYDMLYTCLLHDSLTFLDQSLWSTTDTFGFINLACVMVAVALATYILVFNLNSLVKASQTRYLIFKCNVVDQMMNDPRASWMETGIKFDRYKPRNMPKESKPSEWWVLVYQALKVFRSIGMSRNVESREEGDRVRIVDSRDDPVSRADHPTNVETPGQSWYCRLFHRSSVRDPARS